MRLRGAIAGRGARGDQLFELCRLGRGEHESCGTENDERDDNLTVEESLAIPAQEHHHTNADAKQTAAGLGQQGGDEQNAGEAGERCAVSRSKAIAGTHDQRRQDQQRHGRHYAEMVRVFAKARQSVDICL